MLRMCSSSFLGGLCRLGLMRSAAGDVCGIGVVRNGLDSRAVVVVRVVTMFCRRFVPVRSHG